MVALRVTLVRDGPTSSNVIRPVISKPPPPLNAAPERRVRFEFRAFDGSLDRFLVACIPTANDGADADRSLRLQLELDVRIPTWMVLGVPLGHEPEHDRNRSIDHLGELDGLQGSFATPRLASPIHSDA